MNSHVIQIPLTLKYFQRSKPKHEKKWANAPFKKTIQYFSPLPKLIREMPSFETRFSQNRDKPYSDVFKESIVTF